MKRARLTMAGLALALAGAALAQGTARPAADDPAVEAHMMAIANELRCVVCQNQTVADSDAELAADLREQIRGQLRQGRSADDIRGYMTERYGEFVLYRPPLNTRTALLWGGPAVLMAVGLLVLGLVLRRRQRLPDEAFEPDHDAPDDAAPGPASNEPPHAR
jgi:cytochrome c-type biogenesis protein CcmH